MATVKLSALAEQDLEEIWVYTYSNWSEQQANKYIDKLDEVFQSILNNPKLGKDATHTRKGYRQLSFQKHIIYYTQSDEGDILITRILHQRMDQTSHLQ